jgi:hypothetical protein
LIIDPGRGDSWATNGHSSRNGVPLPGEEFDPVNTTESFGALAQTLDPATPAEHPVRRGPGPVKAVAVVRPPRQVVTVNAKSTRTWAA